MIAQADDNSVEFSVDPGDTVESIIAFYQEECRVAQEITGAAGSLDQLSARCTPVREVVSLRWLLTHMLEETARHAGHLDLMRELIDGRIGD